MKRVATYASFVKLEHTIFSLPLIVAGTLLHVRGCPPMSLVILILLAAISGRVLAMGFNALGTYFGLLSASACRWLLSF